MMFQVGQRVRFIRDSTDGGRTYGAEGDTAVIVRVYNGRKNSFIVQLDKKPKGYHPSAYAKDLAPITPEDTFDQDGVE